MQYDEDGFLPEAVLNYLARLGWSHGDNEVFTMAQFVEWFDLDHITSSAAQFNTEKLLWLNQQYLKQAADNRLAAETKLRLAAQGIATDGGPDLVRVVALYKDRAATLRELADAVHPLYAEIHATAELRAQHLTEAARAALVSLRERMITIAWEKTALGPAIKEAAIAAGLKMPQVAMPLRVLLLGQAQSPSIDAIIEVMGREMVLDRLKRGLA
jgi:glutamyl-tRNA synthetase